MSDQATTVSTVAVARIAILLGIIASPGLGQNQLDRFLITTAAGGDFVFRGDGGPATEVQLSQVFHVITDSQGNVYAADRTNHQVVRIAPNGILTVVAGNGIDGFSGDGGQARLAALSFPAALAFDSSGNFYITDNFNGRIRRVAPNGVITTVAGNGNLAYAGDGGQALNASIESGGAGGLAVDNAGNIYFTETRHHRIRRIAPNGIVTTYAGNGQPGFAGDGGSALQASLNQPEGLAVDGAGNLYVADTRNHRIRRISVSGMITTIAGTGQAMFGGDDGQAIRASLAGPIGVSLGPANEIYIADFGNQRIRVIGADGNIRTIAGSGRQGFGGDGGPALQASLSFPYSAAADSAGNIHIADANNNRIRRVNAQRIIATSGGNGQHRFSGDGGQSVAAAIGLPNGLAADGAGNFYVSDANNHRVRKVDANLNITTIAGTGATGASGDGGLATLATLTVPGGLTTDAAGNLFIADTGNARVRRVSTSGIITTVAGSGTFTGPPVDGARAVDTGLGGPSSVAIDRLGNLFILDGVLCLIFRVTPDGRIFRYAGRLLECGSTGDGGAALSATLLPPGTSPGGGLSVDGLGNVFFTEPNGHRVRRIAPDGTMSTFAGTGRAGFSVDGTPVAAASFAVPASVLADSTTGLALIGDVSFVYLVAQGLVFPLAGNLLAPALGDGGPSRQAAIGAVAGLALDRNGIILLIDTFNARIRAIVVDPPIFAFPTELRFQARSAGAPPPPEQAIVVAAIPGVAFTVSVTTDRGGSWLRATPSPATTPRLIDVSVDPSNLGPGVYTGTITITAPTAVPQTQSLRVTFEVGPAEPPGLAVDQQRLSFAFPREAAPRSQTLMVQNTGGGQLDFTVAAATNNGGPWLSASPSSGRALPGSPAIVTITANPLRLRTGTYTGTITVSAGAATSIVPVTITVSAVDQAILLSQTGLSFLAVSGGGIVPPRRFEVLNIGRGIVNWRVSTSTLSGGQGWLTASPAAGSTNADAPIVPSVDARVNAAGLAPGPYYGLVQVDAPGAANLPQVVTVFLEVLAPGSDPGPLIEPAELVFTAVAGRSSPGAKEVFVYNVAQAPKTFRSTTSLTTRGTDASIATLPADATLAVDQANRVLVQPFIRNLPAGTHRGTVNLQFSDGRVLPVRVQLILTAPEAAAAGRTANGCTPDSLSPAILSLAQSFPVTAGWPVPITAEVRDNCGNALESGSVVVSFSNGEPSVALVPLKNGRWSGTWASRVGPAAPVTLTLEAASPQARITGMQTLSVNLRTRQEPPAVVAEGVVSAAGPQSFVPLAPGGMITVYGDRLAEATEQAAGLPLPTRIGSTRLIMGGRELPLLFVSPGQVNALVPANLPPNTTHQLLVQRANTYGRPVALDVGPAQPAIFINSGVSTTQGHIYFVRPGQPQAELAAPASPARVGDVLVIYAAGLGETQPGFPDREGAPTNGPPLSTREAVTLTIGGVDARVDFAGLAPGFAGLYQINARVPDGVAPGDRVPVRVQVSDQTSPEVTMAVR